MSRYHHLSPAFDDYDSDVQESWLFDGPDETLADYARYRLPDQLLAQIARAYRHGAPIGWIEEILADSRDHFIDDMKTRGEL